MKNKILSLEEVQAAGHGPMWYQHKYCPVSDPVIFVSNNDGVTKMKIIHEYWNRHHSVMTKTYGYLWRCWQYRPSQEDMKKPFKGNE